MTNKPVDDFSQDEINHIYNEYVPLRVIAEIVGHDRETVVRHMLKENHKHPYRPKHGWKPKYDTHEIREMYDSGMVLREIREQTGLTHSTIIKYILLAGGTMRPKGTKPFHSASKVDK